MKITPKMKMTSIKDKDDPKNEHYLKYEDNLKKEETSKNKNDSKNGDNPLEQTLTQN